MTTKKDDEISEKVHTETLKLRSVVYDKTTGLAAFPFLFDQLRSHLDRRRYLGVIHIEITNLDLVESLYGWQVFDRILAKVSGVLQASVGTILPSGALLGINGVAGDHFVAFIPELNKGREVNAQSLSKLALKVCAALDSVLETEEFEGLSPKLAFRAGYSLLSEDPFYRFERRVYAAVEEARTLSSRQEERRERSWGAELKRIIKDAAVSILFQPIVDLETREVYGFEALARGPKDTFFEMPRAMFALSTRVGVAVDLDRLCRDTALKSWGRAAGKGKVFLNVLPGSLADPAWVKGGVGELLEAASIRPEDLVIEVSERAADPEVESFAAVMEKLRAHGFSLALDDVGTGYATLATLEKVQPHYLKVDLSVVRGIHRNLIKQELLSSLVQIARRIGASVIAEGVESEEEAAVLRAAGARYGQGYLFAGPKAMATARLSGKKSRSIDP